MKLFKLIEAIRFDLKKDCVKAIEDYRSSNIKSRIVEYRIGQNYSLLKNWKLALLHFKRSEELGLNSPILFYKIGKCLENLKEKEQACSYYKKAIQKRGDFVPWIERYLACANNEDLLDPALLMVLGKHAYKTSLYFGISKYKEGKYFQAIPYLTDFLSKEPQHIEANKIIAECYYELADYKKAIEYFNEINIKNLKDARSIYHYGLALEANGNKTEALKKYETALKIKGLPLDEGRGTLDKAFSRWELMYLYYKDIVNTKNIQDAMIYYNFGLACDYIGKIYEAKEALESAVAKDNGKTPFIIRRLVYVYKQLGNLKNAEQAARLLIKISKSTTDKFLLASILYANQKYEESCKIFNGVRAGIQIQDSEVPNLETKWKFGQSDESVSWRLGNFYYRKGNFEKGCKYFSGLMPLPYVSSCGITIEKYKNNSKFALRSDYKQYREQPIVEDSILYESFLGNTMSCNPYALFKKIYASDHEKRYLHIWVVNDEETIPPDWRKKENVHFIKRNTQAYAKALATCKFLINNVTFPDWFIKRDSQIYCNTWHGTPLKCLGKSNRHDAYGYGNVTRNFLMADILVNPNKFVEGRMLNEYCLKNIYQGILYSNGYPRNDVLKTTRNDDQFAKHIKEEVLGIKGRKVLLYAPTWRDYEDIETQIQRIKLVYKALETFDFAVIFKGHQFIEKRLQDIGLNCVPRWLDTNELLTAVDILITDYSSIGIDFSLTGRPTIYYVDDAQEYNQCRGLYYNVEDFPGLVAFDAEKLTLILKSISNSQWNIKEDFKEQEQLTSSELSELILNFPNKLTLCPKEKHARPTMLIYGGTLLKNGILSALKAFIKTLSNYYEITLYASAANLRDRAENIQDISEFISIIPRVGNFLMDVNDEFYLNNYKKFKTCISKTYQGIIQNIYELEFRRSFGNAKFDLIVNYEGYNLDITLMLAMANQSMPKICILHNNMLEEQIIRFPYLKMVFENYQHYDKLISVSEPTELINRENLISKFNLASSKFSYLNNFFDTNKIDMLSTASLPQNIREKIESKIVFLNAARLSVEKNQLNLIDAFAEVCKVINNAILIIIGDGYLKLQLCNRIQKHNLEDKILLLGHQDNPYPWMKRCDCFILPSLHEGQPVVLQEAMYLGKPIIASSIQTNINMLDQSPAIFVNETSKSIAEGILTFIDKFHNQKPYKFDYVAYNQKSLNKFLCDIGYQNFS